MAAGGAAAAISAAVVGASGAATVTGGAAAIAGRSSACVFVCVFVRLLPRHPGLQALNIFFVPSALANV